MATSAAGAIARAYALVTRPLVVECSRHARAQRVQVGPARRRPIDTATRAC